MPVRFLAMSRAPGTQRHARREAFRSRLLPSVRLRNPATVRRGLLEAITTAIAITIIATVILTAMALTSRGQTSDKLAAAGDVMVGATLFLAVIAALVALLAYAVSTGLPDLQVSIQFDASSPESSSNNSSFDAEVLDDGTIRAKNYNDAADVYFKTDQGTLTAQVNTGQGKQTTASVFVRNNSGYSARNPAVIIQLDAMAFFDKNELSETWTITNIAEISELDGMGKGCMSVQWDGGPTYSIHGNSIRRLPDLDFSDLWVLPGWGSPGLKIILLADGYRKEVRLPVDFTVDGISQVREEDWEYQPDWLLFSAHSL